MQQTVQEVRLEPWVEGDMLGAEIDLEYPQGNPIRSHDWYVDLNW